MIRFYIIFFLHFNVSEDSISYNKNEIKSLIMIRPKFDSVEYASRIQNNNFYNDKYSYFESKFSDGDIKYLYEFSEYIDDTTVYSWKSGWCSGSVIVNNHFKDLLQKFSIFTKNQINLDLSISKTEFLDFLNNYKDEIHFSELTNKYQITKIRDIEISKFTSSEYKYKNPTLSFARIKNSKILNESQLKFYYEKNSSILLTFASELFKLQNQNYRENVTSENYWNISKDFNKIISILTHEELTFYDEIGKVYEKDSYHDEYYLNLLIYFAKYYKDYKWNEELGYFVKTKE